MLDKLQYFTSTIAGISIIVFSMFNKTDSTVTAVSLIFSLVLFFFVGILVKKYLKKNVFNDDALTANTNDETLEDNDDDSELEDDK